MCGLQRATAVTAVKGDRAHDRAVALRSIFRALKQARIIFTDPTRGLSVTRNEPPPATLPPDRLAGLLDITDRPAIRLALALVTLHALNGTDLNRLTLNDVIAARAQLLVRRPHGRHTVHLDAVTHHLLHIWLRYRHQRWPRTANPHLFVTRQTVIHTGPVSVNYFPAAFQRLGLTPGAAPASDVAASVRVAPVITVHTWSERGGAAGRRRRGRRRGAEPSGQPPTPCRCGLRGAARTGAVTQSLTEPPSRTSQPAWCAAGTERRGSR
ncbi:hypothetical protein ACFTWD_11945 [Streptomyces sp. NPDC056943]|uniref:hypothetical protein n=1 Tax=Streptomyces sp. NPDC056943 TaxID=3345971 RepID=UPI00363BA3EF